MPREIRFLNTLTRHPEIFQSLEEGHARIYTCGPTVYNVVHIGNLRTFLFEDVLRRTLQAFGYRVTQVMNLTDIDDKTIRGAAEEGIALREFTDRYAAAFFEDIDTLGLERAEHYPRATDYVPEMVQLVERLRDRGHTYQLDGSTYFRIASFPCYGKLSGIDPAAVKAGARVDADEYEKEDVRDFVLWKASRPGEPSWETALGPGRPGWHLECSAMGMSLLGESFDIHAGAVDNIFPHHENEIAQSEGVSGRPLARLWMHNGFVTRDNEKMSKSLGNFFTIRDILARYDAETIRFFIIRAHYRSALNHSDAHLDDARNSLRRLYTALSLLTPAPSVIDWADPFAARFKAAMDEDFGTPEAVAVLFDLASEVNKTRSAELAGLLKALGACIGLLQDDPQVFLRAGAALDEATITALIAQRVAAKAARNFTEADRIRQDLAAQGIVLKDSPAGTRWEVKQ